VHSVVLPAIVLHSILLCGDSWDTTASKTNDWSYDWNKTSEPATTNR
jgi:hypothetical protein